MADLTDFPISCPGCGVSYRVPRSIAGTLAACSFCHADFILPEVPATADLPSLAATAAPPKEPGALWKNLLLILTGATLMWSTATYYKQRPSVSAAAPADSTATSPGREVNAVPAAPESIITTTRPARARLLSTGPPTPAFIPAAAPSQAELTIPIHPPETPPDTASMPPAQPEAPPAVSVPDLSPAPAADATTLNSTASPQPDFAELRRDSRRALERFLRAATLEERLAFSQNPDKIRPAMEQHYRTWPGGPQPLEEMTFLTESEVPDTKRKFHLYNVVLRDQEAPIPLAVEQTADGYRVDWPTFAESYTHALRAFFAAPGEAPGRFRVMLRRAHYFGPPVPGQDTVRLAYTVEPPMRDEAFHVWVEKDGLVYRNKLSTGERAGWDAQSYLIVELLWKGDEKRGRWVGLQRIPADSWRAE